MKFGGREARREGEVKNEGDPWPTFERRPRGVEAGGQTVVFELAAALLLLTVAPVVILGRRRRVISAAAAAGVGRTDRETGGAAAVKQTNVNESIAVADATVVVPAQAHVACGYSQTALQTTGGAAGVKQTSINQPVGDAAVIATAQAHVARNCLQTAPQITTTQAVKQIPSTSHLALTEMPQPPPPSCELPLRQSPSSPVLRPGPTPRGVKAEESEDAAWTIVTSKKSAVKKRPPPPSCEVPERQPPSPAEVTLRQGPKPGSKAEEEDAASTIAAAAAAAKNSALNSSYEKKSYDLHEGDATSTIAAAAAAAAAAKNSALNSSYQKQISDLHEALQASQKKLNLAEKDLAAAKQAVARALSAKRQKGGEQRATIVRLEDALHEERKEFRNLRQRSIEASRALGEADEKNAATLKAFAQFKEATQAKVVRLGREAAKSKDLERQLARKDFQHKRLKEEVVRLKSDAREIEGLLETVESKDVEIERMKREWWCARNEARRANRTPCLMVERAAQDILAREAALS